jgi:hypothetical protein
MFKKLISLIKFLWKSEERYLALAKRLEILTDRTLSAEKLIRDRTEVNADVAYHPKGLSTVIVMGRYRNNDFVQTYSVESPVFHSIVERLRSESRYGNVSFIDAPPAIKQFIKQEL